MIPTDSPDYNNIIKLIMSKNQAFISDSEGIMQLNEILNEKYQINLHIADEKVFLSLVGSLMNKSLDETIQSEVDQM